MSCLFVIKFAVSCVLPWLFIAPALANDVPTVKSAETLQRVASPNLLKQLKQAEPGNLQIPFELNGTLVEGSAITDEGILFDVYAFVGTANQIIKIDLSSEDFDTAIILLDADGVLDDNDDSNGSTDSTLVYRLPKSGIYRVVVRTYEVAEQGTYQLSAREGTEKDLKKSEADRLNQEGVLLYRQSQFQEAQVRFLQALAINREIRDRLGEGTTLHNIGGTYFKLEDYSQALEI